MIPKFISTSTPAERKAAAISALLLFSTIAAYIILKSARDAFFLSRFKARTLPYFMGLSTIITTVTATFYLRVYNRISVEKGVKLGLLLFCIGTLLFFKALDQHNRILICIFYAWVTLFGTLGTVQAWLLISRQFLTRQARRMIGIIGAGGVIGGIAGGLLARFTSEISTAHTLIPLASLCMLSAFTCTLFLSPAETAVEEEPPEADQTEVSRKLIWLILLVVAIGTLCSTLIEFEFKTAAQETFRAERRLAIFFGSFYAYTGAGALVIQLVATPFLMRRFGITTTLSFLPFALLITNSFAVVSVTFTSILIVKLTEELFSHSIDRSSVEVLYVAIPERQKVRLKSLIDTVGVRGAEGIGAVLLILLFSLLHLSIHTLIVITLAFVAAWFTATILLGREYPQLLRNRLQRKDLDFAKVKEELFSTDFYRLLPQLLRDGETQNIHDLLEILETSNKRWLGRYLHIPLRHEDPKIRLKTLQLLFDQDANLSSVVKNLLEDPDPRIRAEAAHYLCLRSHLEEGQTEKFLEKNDLVLQAAVCACALKTRPDEKIVYEKLEQLIKESLSNSDPEPRIEISHVLQYAPLSEHVERICAILLKDPEEKVRKSALKMIERTHPARMFGQLIRLIRDPSLLKEVRSALAGYGESLLPQLRKIVEDESTSLEQKKLALKVAGDIGGVPALGFLLEIAHRKEPSVRFAALKALNRLRKNESCELDQAILSSLLEEEIARLEQQAELERIFSPSKDHLLNTFLRQRRQWGIERIFRMLGLMFDAEAIYSAYLAWISGNFRKTDTALEFLDTLITPELRSRILPLLEFEGPAVTLAGNGVLEVKENEVGSKMITARINEKRADLTRKEAFFSFLREKDPMLASLAISDLTEKELKEWQEEIRKELQDFPSTKLVEETLKWRLNMTTTADPKETTLTTIQKMEFLNKMDMFSRLGAQEVLLLADVSEVKTFEANEQIYKEGEFAHEIFGIIEGSIELSRSKGHVRTLGPGETFASHGVLVNKSHLFSAKAKTKSTCLRIDRESFREILEEYPSIARGIFGVLVEQIEILTDKMLDARDKGNS